MFNKVTGLVFAVVFIYLFVTVWNNHDNIKQKIQDSLIKGDYQEAKKLSRFLFLRGLNVQEMCSNGIETKIFQKLCNVKSNNNIEKLMFSKYKASQVKSLQMTEQNKIPYLTHYIWATSEKHPKEISSGNIKRIKDTLITLKTNNPNYNHYLWVNNRKLIPHTIKQLSEYKVIVKNISSLSRFKEFQDVLSFLEKFNFASYSDFVRLLVTEEYGGIYMDVDVHLYKEIEVLEYIHKFFDLFMVYGINDGYETQNGFFIVSPNHQLIKNYISMYADIVRGKEFIEWQTLCSKTERVYSLGPPLLTAEVFRTTFKKGHLNLFLPFGSVFEDSHFNRGKKDPVSINLNGNIIMFKTFGTYGASNSWKESLDLSSDYIELLRKKIKIYFSMLNKAFYLISEGKFWHYVSRKF